MKNLYLLRHCQADGAFGAPDKLRNLSPHGVAEAEALGRYLKDYKISFDRVLCSSAVRTSETVDHMVHGGVEVSGHIEFLDELYNASAGQIYEIIKSAPKTAERLLIVAHNPGIHEISKFLTGMGNKPLLDRQASFSPPGCMNMLECRIEDWRDLASMSNTLKSWIDPSFYLPSDTSNLL